MFSWRTTLTAAIVIGLLPVTLGCPQSEQAINILLVNTRDRSEVRALYLYDSGHSVTGNLMEVYLPPLSSRSISVPFDATYEADEIGIAFGPPGDDITVYLLPDNVEGGFEPGKRIVFVLTPDGAFDVPSG